MPYVLPAPEPKRKWYNDYGEAQGVALRLLLAALAGGATGAPTSSSPIPTSGGLGAGAIFPAGQPGASGQAFPPIQPGSAGQVTVAPPPVGMGQPSPSPSMSDLAGSLYSALLKQPLKTGLERQQAQADLAYNQARTQSLTPEFQAELYQRIFGIPLPRPSNGGPLADQGGFSQSLSTLRQQSEQEEAAGQDGPATQRLRLILQLLRGD